MEKPMNPQEMKAIRLLLGRDGRPMSQAEFAALIFRSPRMVAYYEAGRQPIPPEVAKIARTLLSERGQRS
ncbi:MAG TPA: helix-turn-helix transcriptional regulator [Burkholderiales bacterium]|nr:helix-turn-helix transcriptional regulator [Burkholderiales bacterium]